MALALILADAAAAAVTLSVPKIEGKPGQEIDVPIVVKGGQGLSALQMRLSYDPAVLTAVTEPGKLFAKGKALPGDPLMDVSAETPGGITILFACGIDPKKKDVQAIEEDGTLLTIRFRVSGKTGDKSPLTLEKAQAFRSNQMDMMVQTEAGELNVSSSSSLPLLWIGIGVGALLLLVILVAALRGGSKAQPVVQPGGSLPRFSPEGAATFVHTCNKCGGTIQLPRAMLGQAFQCGACGATQTGRA